jgi:hypothetical protein
MNHKFSHQYHFTMVLHAYISPGWWTIGPLVAADQRRSLTSSTWWWWWYHHHYQMMVWVNNSFMQTRICEKLLVAYNRLPKNALNFFVLSTCNNLHNNNYIYKINNDDAKPQDLILLFKIPMSTQKNFPVNYWQLGHVLSKRFASPGIVHMNKNVYGWLHAPIQILSTVHLKEKLIRLGRGGGEE